MPSPTRRLLVDECVPRPLVRALADLAPITVQEAGWAGFKNGRLLAAAVERFDVVFTVDRDFANLADTVPVAIGLVILQVGTTDFEKLLPHADAVRRAIGEVQPGKIIRLGG